MTSNKVRQTVEVQDVSECRTILELKDYADKLFDRYGNVEWEHFNREEWTCVVLSRDPTEEEIRIEEAVERLTSELYRCTDMSKHMGAVYEIGKKRYDQIIEKLNSKR